MKNVSFTGGRYQIWFVPGWGAWYNWRIIKAKGGCVKALHRKFPLAIALAMIAVGWHTPARAGEENLIANSAQCTQHFGRLERQYGIPKHLMMAIGGTESGRWSKEVNMAVPWPWTINAEGKGQYFETMHEAVTAVKRLQQRGVKSIDVGCMQVNLKHHPNAFASVTQAFDPAYNTTYAAKFLRRNYDDTRSWSEAIAAYHSKGTQRGRDYFGRVKYNWKRVLAAVRGEPFNELPYVARGGEGAQLAELTVRDASGGLKLSRAGKEAASLNRYHSPTMKIIKVSDTPSQSPRRDGVLVIRPDTAKKAEADAPVVVASNFASDQLLDDEFVTGAGIRRPLGNTSAPKEDSESTSSRKKGPNFIFN